MFRSLLPMIGCAWVACAHGQTLTAMSGEIRCEVMVERAPALAEWSEKEMLPVVVEWVPKLVKLLPGEGWQPPKQVVLEYRDDMKGVPAYAAGNRVSLNAPWFSGQLKGEAKGCVIHELVHVMQGYGGAKARNPQAKPTPSWVTEGIADYIRWFLYEPEKKGAVIRDPAQAKHDASYRVTANFFDWVVRNKKPDMLAKLNQTCREGNYSDEWWKTATGMTLPELADAWRADLAAKR